MQECHKTESLWNHTTTEHKEGEQLEDQRSFGVSSCNCGDGTDQRVQFLMFMTMMVFMMMMTQDWSGFHTCKECHKTESLWNHTTTDHKEGEQLEDQRSTGASSCNCGDGTDHRVQSLMFMMMMIMMMFMMMIIYMPRVSVLQTFCNWHYTCTVACEGWDLIVKYTFLIFL